VKAVPRPDGGRCSEPDRNLAPSVGSGDLGWLLRRIELAALSRRSDDDDAAPAVMGV
jgi:hypothetical protein